MILYAAHHQGNKYITQYPLKITVDTADALKQAVAWDHVCATYTNNQRSNRNFLCADTIMMDIDNSDTEDPRQWITLAYVQHEFQGYAVTSRNHLKVKNGKPARPKFHVYFPLPEPITDIHRYTAVKQTLLEQYPFFDKGVKDAARFFFGNPEAEVFELTGKVSIVDILASVKTATQPPRRIPQTVPTDHKKKYTVTKSPAADWERGTVAVGSRHTTLPSAVGQWKNAHYDFSEVERILTRNAPEPDEQKNLIDYANKLWKDFDDTPPRNRLKQGNGRQSPAPDTLAKTILNYYLEREKDHPLLGNFGEHMDFCESGCALYIADVFRNMFAVVRKDLYVFHPTLKYYLSGAKADMPKVVLRHLLHYCKRVEQETIKDKQRINEKPDAATIDFAKKLGSKRFFNHVYEFLLLTDQALICDGFGGQPHEVNINGEYYNLKTGEHRPATEQDRFDRCIRIQPSYTPTKVFDQCLNDWFGKPDVAAYLWRFMGHCLTGDNSAGKFINFYGQGGNGKGKLLDVLQLLLGEYAAVCDDDLVINKNNKDTARLMAELQTLRLAIFPDVDETGSFNMSAIKKITGGNAVVARKLYKENECFRPECKIILATNRQIVIKHPKEADRRRFVYLPFERIIPEDQRDEHLLEKLTQELPGILQRVITEAYRFYQEGLIKSDTINTYTNDYIQAEDSMGNFLRERTIERTAYRLPFKTFMNAYNEWLRENNLKELSSTALGRLVRERGDLTYKKGKYENYFEDLDIIIRNSEMLTE